MNLPLGIGYAKFRTVLQIIEEQERSTRKVQIEDNLGKAEQMKWWQRIYPHSSSN